MRADSDAILLEGLNPEQREAVTTESPKVLVIAGAGTGKTHVLARRVCRLIAGGCPADLILCVTFTRKAASEMRERIARYLDEIGYREHAMPEIRTLHAWGTALLRQHAAHFGLTREFTIYDEVDREDVIRAVARDRNHKTPMTSRLETLWKDQAIRREYRGRLLVGNAIDFEQIEEFTLRLLAEVPEVRSMWTGRYRHVLVDEFQDTNLAQTTIVQNLEPPSFFVVGDARQAIYRFRGADPTILVEAARSSDYTVIELVTNYRSVPEIVAFGNGCVDGSWAPMRSGRPNPLLRVEASDGLSDWLALHLPDGVAVGEIGDDGHLCARSGRWFRAERVSQETGTWETREHHPERVQAWASAVEPAMVGALVGQLVGEGLHHGDIAVLGRTWAAVDAEHEVLRCLDVPVNYCGTDDDCWSTEDGRAIARALLLALNPRDDNLAGFLAEWGSMGARRFPDLRAQRSKALSQRRPLLDVLADEHPQWARARAALLHTEIELPSPRDLVPAVDAALGVSDTYQGRSLASRVATIRECITEAARHRDLEDFRDWWNGRSTAERLDAHRDAVRLMTVHAAKGLEWPAVILVDCRDGAYPSARATATVEDRAEDLRVFYVGVTRARDRLVCTVPTTYKPPWGPPGVATVTPYLSRPGAPTVETWAIQSWGGRRPVGW